MRAPWLSVPAALLIGLASLAGCDRPAQPTAEGGRTLTIRKTEEPPPPKPAAPVGPKLAVMDAPANAEAAIPVEPASPLGPARPLPARDERYDPPRESPSDPRDRADYDPYYDGDPAVHVVAPSPRDCQRAVRRGEPLADSRACRQMLADARPPPADPGLVADCIEADRIGDAFADSRACRRLLDR